jgi:hypothetical protein
VRNTDAHVVVQHANDAMRDIHILSDDHDDHDESFRHTGNVHERVRWHDRADYDDRDYGFVWPMDAT